MRKSFLWILLTAVYFVTPAAALESADTLVKAVEEPRFGDYSAMKEAKVVRVAIPYSVTNYYLDRGKEKGITAEYMREFEKFLNGKIKRELDRIRIVMIPTSRDRLISTIVDGAADVAVANLTVTSERLEHVDFSDPIFSDAREIVVTGKEIADIAALEALAGMEIHVRKSSSYFESLQKTNNTLKDRNLAPVSVVIADEQLEDEDLLEMIDGGLIPAIVIDEHKAKLWSTYFRGIKMHPGFALREGGDIAWAIRKESPELKKTINAFLDKSRVGTTLGNILMRRYYSEIGKVINPKSEAYQKQLDYLIDLFQKSGKKYNIDPMLIAAQAFQESRFDNAARSQTGAVGIMQVLPSTAKDKNVNIPNIKKLEDNVEAGAKYMRFVADTYFDDPDIPELDRILFVFASYNAGPNRVARVRKKATDPNKWFGSVEWEVARAAGAEPVKYVKNIYIYYVLFKKLTENR